MKEHELDQAPEMIEMRVGDEGNETVFSIPKSAITDLPEAEADKVIGAISRFVFFVATGNAEGDRQQGIEDIATVLGIEDMMMTLPGAEHPTTIHNFLGSMAVTASQQTKEEIRGYTGLNLD